MVGRGRRYAERDLYGVCKSSVDARFDFFDTAPSYGRGEAESMIGRFRKRDGRPVIAAMKFDNATFFTPSSSRNSAKAAIQAIDASLQRLCTERVDLHQIHFPVPEREVDEYAETKADRDANSLAEIECR